MKWSKLKSLVEKQFAASVQPRVSIFSTAYGNCSCGRAWLTVDGEEIVNFCTRAAANVGLGWSDWVVPPMGYGELSRQDAYKACWAVVHDLTIDAALADEDPLVQTLAVLDRRLGKRRLRNLDWNRLHPLAQEMFALRLGCEDLVRADLQKRLPFSEHSFPVTIDEANKILDLDLQSCSDEQRQLFEQIRIRPRLIYWQQHGKLERTWETARIDGQSIWYENIHQSFEIHTPDADGILRPESFGDFDLSHILHNLLAK